MTALQESIICLIGVSILMSIAIAYIGNRKTK